MLLFSGLLFAAYLSSNHIFVAIVNFATTTTQRMGLANWLYIMKSDVGTKFQTHTKTENRKLNV